MKFDRYSVALLFMAITIVMFAAFIADVRIVVFIQDYLEWIVPLALVIALMTFTYGIMVKDVGINQSIGNARKYLVKTSLVMYIQLIAAIAVMLFQHKAW